MKTCQAGVKVGHSPRPCGKPAVGVVLEVWGESPYDLHVCREHTERFSGKTFVALNGRERDPSTKVVIP